MLRSSTSSLVVIMIDCQESSFKDLPSTPRVQNKTTKKPRLAINYRAVEIIKLLFSPTNWENSSLNEDENLAIPILIKNCHQKANLSLRT